MIAQMIGAEENRPVPSQLITPSAVRVRNIGDGHAGDGRKLYVGLEKTARSNTISPFHAQDQLATRYISREESA